MASRNESLTLLHTACATVHVACALLTAVHRACGYCVGSCWAKGLVTLLLPGTYKQQVPAAGALCCAHCLICVNFGHGIVLCRGATKVLRGITAQTNMVVCLSVVDMCTQWLTLLGCLVWAYFVSNDSLC